MRGGLATRRAAVRTRAEPAARAGGHAHVLGGHGHQPDRPLREALNGPVAAESRSRATGGVGLGLTLARRIVQAHGGSVGFVSEPNRGSRFWVVLPLAQGSSGNAASPNG